MGNGKVFLRFLWSGDRAEGTSIVCSAGDSGEVAAGGEGDVVATSSEIEGGGSSKVELL